MNEKDFSKLNEILNMKKLNISNEKREEIVNILSNLIQNKNDDEKFQLNQIEYYDKLKLSYKLKAYNLLFKFPEVTDENINNEKFINLLLLFIRTENIEDADFLAVVNHIITICLYKTQIKAQEKLRRTNILLIILVTSLIIIFFLSMITSVYNGYKNYQAARQKEENVRTAEILEHNRIRGKNYPVPKSFPVYHDINASTEL